MHICGPTRVSAVTNILVILTPLLWRQHSTFEPVGKGNISQLWLHITIPRGALKTMHRPRGMLGSEPRPTLEDSDACSFMRTTAVKSFVRWLILA